MALSPINACATRGATPANGVNAARAAALPLTYVQSLMDSVRYQRVSAERQKGYQQQIAQYYTSQANLPALEQYTATLHTANPTAYYTLSLALLRIYVAQHQKSEAQRLRQQLLPLAVVNNGVQQEIAWLDLRLRMDTWPSAGNRLLLADSLSLDQIAASGTSVAEDAATWLRYYYPHAAPYRGPRVPPVTAVAKPRPQELLPESGLYPNPAATAAVARYQTATPGMRIELQVFDLLTSKQVLSERLPASGQTETYSEYPVDVRRLPAGQYSYRFLVGGNAQPSHHLIIQK